MANYTKTILLENALSLKEKREIISVMESSESSRIDNVMISNLYKSALDKSYIDFDNIPESKGNIKNYEGYTSMKETLSLVKNIADVQKVKLPELETVITAVTNLENLAPYYEKGFKLERSFVILNYNTMVLSCVEATSIILSSYVDYVRKINSVEVTILKNKKLNGYLCIDSLSKFNNLVISGELEKILRAETDGNNLVGTASVAIPMVLIGGLLIVLPMMRELVYYYYNTRMNVSDYLNQQAQFLEFNREVLEANKNIPAKKKNEIIKKQDKIAKDLVKMADKIKVNYTLTETKSSKEAKKEESTWSFGNLNTDSLSTDSQGFKLL